MPRYIRARVAGGTYFFTVALHDRRRRLLVEHIDDLRTAVRGVKSRRPFRLDAIVVLPEHLHCIWTLPPDDDDFSTRWRLIKRAFAVRVEPGEPLSGRRRRTGERGIWQRRFWEHVIRDEADLHRHLDYIHYNPVKHGHVKRPLDWPYSSLHKYVRDGLYAPDWAATPATRELDME